MKMEKILAERIYDIPSVVNRDVDLVLDHWDKTKEIFVRIISPEGFENAVLIAKKGKNGPKVSIHKRINDKVLHPKRRVLLRIYQISEKVETIVSKQPDPVVLNPETIPAEEKQSVIKTLFSGTIRPKDWKSHAVEQTKKRKERLARLKSEVTESSPLKPSGLDGKTIMTADDVGYSRGMAIIEIAMAIQAKHNADENLTSPNQQKLLFEFYDIFSFSGIGMIIGFYIALGKKTKGKGDLNFLSNWYRNELCKVFSPTSIGEIAKKGKQLANGLKPKRLRKAPNPGFSIRQAEKIIGELFLQEFTNEPLRMKDLETEVYQPMFLDDRQTRVYSRGETPNAKIIDVILNTALDPIYFQSRKIEKDFGISLGPARRSFDLPIGQYNKDIKLISIGSEVTYQESEKDLEGINPSQAAFLNKEKNHLVEYLDTKKYMMDHPEKVNYLRIEFGQTFGVTVNSIHQNDLDACVKSVKRSKSWSNVTKPLLQWS